MAGRRGVKSQYFYSNIIYGRPLRWTKDFLCLRSTKNHSIIKKPSHFGKVTPVHGTFGKLSRHFQFVLMVFSSPILYFLYLSCTDVCLAWIFALVLKKITTISNKSNKNIQLLVRCLKKVFIIWIKWDEIPLKFVLFQKHISRFD